MKHKILSLILALTAVAWAQTSTQTAPANEQKSAPADQANCACCEKMASADSKAAKMCSRHGKHTKNAKCSCCAGKDAMSCCGKDGKSCMNDEKTAASCCKDCGNDKTASTCCGKNCKEGCCSKKTESAMNCGRHANNS